MGPAQSNQNSQVTNPDLLNKLNYHDQLQGTRNFNEIVVYRLNEKPYDYYLRFRETIVDSQNARKNIQQKKQLYRAFQNIRCLVRVDASKIKCVTDLCSNTLQFDSYARYYNYTLEDAIQCKLRREKKFKESDLFYIMGNLLQVGQKVTSILGRSYKGLFKAYKVYLSTEGYLKIYSFQLISIANIQPLRNHQDSVTSSSQVEVNTTPKKSHEEEKAKNFKDDLKDLAILMIQLILLNKNDDYGSPRKEQLQFLLDRQVCRGLKMLLLGLINNKNDYNYEIVSQQLQNIKQQQKIRISYCIRLQEDIRESEIVRRQEQDINIQRQQQLRRLQNIQYLVPDRIEMVNNRRNIARQN